jgi:hypothetical protein
MMLATVSLWACQADALSDFVCAGCCFNSSSSSSTVQRGAALFVVLLRVGTGFAESKD